MIFEDKIFKYLHLLFKFTYTNLFKKLFEIEHDGTESDRFFFLYCRIFTREMAMYMVIASYSCILVEVLRIIKNPFKPQMQYLL